MSQRSHGKQVERHPAGVIQDSNFAGKASKQ